jgi:hypothetical protein
LGGSLTYWGTCVDLPQPVPPDTMVTSHRAISPSSSPLVLATGRAARAGCMATQPLLFCCFSNSARRVSPTSEEGESEVGGRPSCPTLAQPGSVAPAPPPSCLGTVVLVVPAPRPVVTHAVGTEPFSRACGSACSVDVSWVLTRPSLSSWMASRSRRDSAMYMGPASVACAISVLTCRR